MLTSNLGVKNLKTLGNSYFGGWVDQSQTQKWKERTELTGGPHVNVLRKAAAGVAAFSSQTRSVEGWDFKQQMVSNANCGHEEPSPCPQLKTVDMNILELLMVSFFPRPHANTQHNSPHGLLFPCSSKNLTKLLAERCGQNVGAKLIPPEERPWWLPADRPGPQRLRSTQSLFCPLPHKNLHCRGQGSEFSSPWPGGALPLWSRNRNQPGQIPVGSFLRK